MFTPTMHHIGQITGVGDAYLFGMALHPITDDRADTVYLNLAGPVTSVESVWANLTERRTVAFCNTIAMIKYSYNELWFSGRIPRHRSITGPSCGSSLNLWLTSLRSR